MSDPLDYFRSELNRLHAYAVPDASGLVKLDAMENPYRLPDDIKKKWLKFLEAEQINRYPAPNPEVLKQKLQTIFGPKDDCGFLFGNGSDELIQLLVMAIAKPNACIMSVTPSFSMYQMIGDIVGVKSYSVNLDENFELDFEALLAAIEKHSPSLLFLAYPNNPTGNLWKRDQIETIVTSTNGFVIIDEAYGPFASDSFVDDLAHYKNMLLLRTASKLGLAGIRFGWLVGNAEIIAELNKLRLPYNINQLTQLTLEFALDNFQIFAQQAKTLCDSRSKLFAELSAINEIKAYPSQANFILIKVLSKDATQVFENLLSQKILIKNLSKQNGLDQCLRITVGTEEENNQLLTALDKALS
ncbi:MAG: histidinol-phosphate transaminase [Pseudomonadota bacterium]